MNNLEVFLSSDAGKKFFNFFYSWGAAVVIIGAMFKIVHLRYADIILMVGMITEALVFFISGFDNSSGDTVPAGSGVVVGGDISHATDSNGKIAAAESVNVSQKGKGGGSGSVVIIGGGGAAAQNTGGGITPSGIASSSVPSTPSLGSQNIVGGSTASNTGGGTQSTQSSANVNAGSAPEYGQSISNTAQNLEDFSNTIQSLNDASQKLLSAYNQMSAADGFVGNLTTLNQNVSGLNEVFNAQLQTINEQMTTVRYINDSLNRMKNLYDGAIGDSYMFREESAKMTKHIEALNNVYARLLQAMTTNNNPNQPNY